MGMSSHQAFCVGGPPALVQQRAPWSVLYRDRGTGWVSGMLAVSILSLCTLRGKIFFEGDSWAWVLYFLEN